MSVASGTANTPEPAPAQSSGPAVWDLVTGDLAFVGILDAETLLLARADDRSQMIEDGRERDRIGAEKVCKDLSFGESELDCERQGWAAMCTKASALAQGPGRFHYDYVTGTWVEPGTTITIGAVVISREAVLVDGRPLALDAYHRALLWALACTGLAVTRAQLHAATGARDFDPAAERQVDRAIGRIREELDDALRIRWERVGYVLEVSP